MIMMKDNFVFKVKDGSKKGVFNVEFATLIVLILLALLAMQFYLRNAMCGRLRDTADGFGQGRQYEPGVTIVTEQ